MNIGLHPQTQATLYRLAGIGEASRYALFGQAKTYAEFDRACEREAKRLALRDIATLLDWAVRR